MVAMWQELREKAADADDEQLRRVWDDAGCAACRDPATRELCGSGTVPVDAADRIRFSILSMHASRFPIGRPAGRPGFSHMSRCLSCHVSESRQEMLREWRSGFCPPRGREHSCMCKKVVPVPIPVFPIARSKVQDDARCKMQDGGTEARCKMQDARVVRRNAEKGSASRAGPGSGLA